MMRSLNTALYLILNGMIRIPFYVRLRGLPSSSKIKKNGHYVDSGGLTISVLANNYNRYINI